MLYRMVDKNDRYIGVFNIETGLIAGFAVVNPRHLYDWVPSWLDNGRPDELASRRRRATGHRQIEHRLGTLIADTAREIARARIEYRNGKLAKVTKKEFGDLIFALYQIWYVSRFDCWDRERRTFIRYFAGPNDGDPRMPFTAAAWHYGMEELRKRYPDEPTQTLVEVLSGVFHLMDYTLKRLTPTLDPKLLQGAMSAFSTPSKPSTIEPAKNG